ncbi:MAG TPA: hypothetical protein VNP04_21970 [Alphaproteobacteria bacterium]|nr:hypothetical protein [Alphaproteobacteria bacterium]
MAKPLRREAGYPKQKVEQDPQKRHEILKKLVRFLVPTDPNDPTKQYADSHWVTVFCRRGPAALCAH